MADNGSDLSVEEKNPSVQQLLPRKLWDIEILNIKWNDYPTIIQQLFNNYPAII